MNGIVIDWMLNARSDGDDDNDELGSFSIKVAICDFETQTYFLLNLYNIVTETHRNTRC